MMPRTSDGDKRVTPEREVKNAAPVTRVKSAGRVSRRLEVLAKMYLRTRPDKAVRFVYSPEHKPELSNVTSRHIDGYRMVYVKDLGDDVGEMLPGMKPKDPVRVGDVVMMSIDADVRQELLAELDQAAAGELDRVEEEFHGAVKDMELEVGMRDEYKARPRGRSLTEIVEREVDVPEAHKES
jgi:hypothetical protein